MVELTLTGDCSIIVFSHKEVLSCLWEMEMKCTCGSLRHNCNHNNYVGISCCPNQPSQSVWISKFYVFTL